MNANPVLAEQTRGPWVENRHRGAFVVCDAAGKVIVAAGDVAQPVFPRSALKSIQALAIFTSWAAERFGITDEELALACASHRGQDVHANGVTSFLHHIHLEADDLECGAHAPTDNAARKALLASGASPSAIHNTCSGKHSGMLSVAEALGVPTEGYVERDHPVQREVRRVIELVVGEPLSVDRCGRDGCSIPTWAASLAGFARGFARMATGEGLPTDIARAGRRIFDAATSHPLLVAGTGHFDTVTMEAFRGRLMHKGGADGVQCGAIRDKGWGYALKCDDGNSTASMVMIAEILARTAEPDAAQAEVLAPFRRQTVHNVRKFDVGEMRASDELVAILRPNRPNCR